MCGGRGTRLDTDVEKPLYEVAGRPLVDHVCDALADSTADAVYAAPSPETPGTRRHLAERSIPCIETPGEGYVADLSAALGSVSDPVVTAAADLPLLSPAVLDRIIDSHKAGSLAVAVPAALKEALGVSYDRSFEQEGRRLVSAGLNVVSERGEERTVVSFDARLAVNVNRLPDGAVAEQLSDPSAGGAH